MSAVPGLCEGVIFITCQAMTPALIFNNGLNQNIIIFYRLFTLMGYKPYLLVNGPMDSTKLPGAFHDLRWITLDTYIQNPFNVKVLLEIGMNMGKKVRGLLHMMGARVVKLYLGNSLNIDTEMSLFSNKNDIVIHSKGDIDLVLTSPHYASQLDYLRVINEVSEEAATIAPYVWDPMFINAYGQIIPKSPVKDILIIEPNISFQKSCVIPLLICEKYYVENPSFAGKVHVYNTDKYEDNGNFFTNILNNLALWKDGRIELHSRFPITEILQKYPSSLLLCHQTNNEYNYMYLEALYRDFPLVHNSAAWKEAGNYYECDSLEGGVAALRSAFLRGGSSSEEGRKIMWNHSIYNPAVQEAWLRLLEDDSVTSDK
jgi:hypothetical protein